MYRIYERSEILLCLNLTFSRSVRGGDGANFCCKTNEKGNSPDSLLEIYYNSNGFPGNLQSLGLAATRMERVREPRGGLRLRAAYVPSTCRLRAVYVPAGWQTGAHIKHMPMLKLCSHVLLYNK